MTVTLYEIEPGVWIVPELVAGVHVEALYNTMTHEGFCVALDLVGGGTVRVRRYSTFGVPVEDRPAGVHSADEWIAYGHGVATDVVAWIDARRREPLRIVRS